jgi:hypothetical protein
MNIRDDLTWRYRELLDETYDCVDRIVLNAYFAMGSSGGGFRVWWQRLFGTEEKLDDTHLMRFSGHFSRRIHAFCAKKQIPLIHCGRKQRKEEISSSLLPDAPEAPGLFAVIVGKAPASLREVIRFRNGQIHIRQKKSLSYANYYAFHIMDAQWGHVIIRFCPHPPFFSQIILNGHEYVARQCTKKGIDFSKDDNCFTGFSNAAAFTSIADSMNAPGVVGRLAKVCERWIYSCCLCFALTTDEQKRSGFRYSFSVYQAEYSRNLLFTRGRQMEQIFDSIIDHTRAALNIKTIRTIFGYKCRPYHRDAHGKPPRLEAKIERPAWNLTVFKIHFGKLTAKIYSKGERVLRIECIAHNVKELRCGCILERYQEIINALREMVEHFTQVLDCVDASFIHNDLLRQWSLPGTFHGYPVAGIDVNAPRMRAVTQAFVALSTRKDGFRTIDLANIVNDIFVSQSICYSSRQAAYDLKKFRAKGLVEKKPNSLRYMLTENGIRSIVAFQILREKVIEPLLENALSDEIPPKRKPQPKSNLEKQYVAVQQHMSDLFKTLGIAA